MQRLRWTRCALDLSVSAIEAHRHLIDCLRNGLPLDQDVYDTALWSVIAPLSERSVKTRSNSVDIPDFTRGAWATNAKIELCLNGGGNTGMK